jgi:hypothetical protein
MVHYIMFLTMYSRFWHNKCLFCFICTSPMPRLRPRLSNGPSDVELPWWSLLPQIGWQTKPSSASFELSKIALGCPKWSRVLNKASEKNSHATFALRLNNMILFLIFCNALNLNQHLPCVRWADTIELHFCIHLKFGYKFKWSVIC